MKHAALILSAALLASGATAFAAAPTAKMKAAVADTGRPSADTQRDENRKPAEMLAFAGITPGKVVVDLLPGGGYFTRIFARAVEPNGRVYAYVSDAGDERLKSQGKDPDNQLADLKQTYKNLGVIHGDLNEFVTPEPVDVVWTSDNYHDLHNPGLKTDVAKLNQQIFKALKPGGYYVIIDHKAQDAAADDVTSKLHRMKEATVKQELQAAGFKLVAEGHDLDYPGDDGSQRVQENSIR
ncbi:MAG TPA: hypothetical protein VH189_15955, partial [Rhizomicrobium sp.]|nr:hypothetical protein [Rhizomicrobium sp.]